MRARSVLVILIGLTVGCPSVMAASDQQSDPSFMRGFGKVVGGVLFELPKTLIDATMTSPPIIGIPVGLLAGSAQAFRVTCEGVREMAAGFDPWGSKPPRSTLP